MGACASSTKESSTDTCGRTLEKLKQEIVEFLRSFGDHGADMLLLLLGGGRGGFGEAFKVGVI